ncbi:MAG: microcin ABC transporter permease, partial [Amylibacter sp.]|nr:microcin ABC transporter permease [Amylibacter sp.]
MSAYILRRLFLIIPTLVGIMLINFVLIQFVPGGPIEQIIAQMEDGSAGATDRFTGSGDDSNNQSENNEYKGARGLPPEL